MKGTLYLIPTPLGDGGELSAILPDSVQQLVRSLDYFVAENPKTTRQFLKRVGTTRPLQEISISTLNEHTPVEQIPTLLGALMEGKDVGLVSEAGCPAVADPGALLVAAAHREGIKVVPMVGPSSILLALMASGMSGQSFVFHGYLPANREERIKRLRELEKESRAKRQTQIFIETPYRNLQMFEDVVSACQSHSQLCLAVNLTQSDELIETHSMAEWRGRKPEVEKKPAIFLLFSGSLVNTDKSRKPR